MHWYTVEMSQEALNDKGKLTRNKLLWYVRVSLDTDVLPWTLAMHDTLPRTTFKAILPKNVIAVVDPSGAVEEQKENDVYKPPTRTWAIDVQYNIDCDDGSLKTVKGICLVLTEYVNDVPVLMEKYNTEYALGKIVEVRNVSGIVMYAVPQHI